MKILKAKTSHPKKQIFQISKLNYIPHGLILDDIMSGADMIEPIIVKKLKKSKTQRYGANGSLYIEKDNIVLKGSQRITTAVKLGYTHIEGIYE